MPVDAAPNPSDLAAWNGPAIHAACSHAYSRYERELRAHYEAYFEEHSEFRGDHPLKARDLEAALPEGWGHLADVVPRKELHTHHLSGKSSQVLGIGLLGAANEVDPSGAWLWTALEPSVKPPRPGSQPPIQLEQPLAADVLDEHPRQTAVDVLGLFEDSVVCAELKWAEAGIGTCSCAGDPLLGECSTRVLKRSAYWDTAATLGFPPHEGGSACPISWNYQAVRNIAAARALGGDRDAVFALIYDENNPYFGGHGDWPGWPKVLDATMSRRREVGVRFAATTWTNLAQIVCSLPGMEAVAEWARTKHRLRV